MAHTPMEILRNKLQFVVDELKDEVPETYQYGYRLAMENVIKDIDLQMLEPEKQEYIDAYNQGYRDGDRGTDIDKRDIAQFDDANNYFINKYKK